MNPRQVYMLELRGDLLFDVPVPPAPAPKPRKPKKALPLDAPPATVARALSPAQIGALVWCATPPAQRRGREPAGISRVKLTELGLMDSSIADWPRISARGCEVLRRVGHALLATAAELRGSRG